MKYYVTGSNHEHLQGMVVEAKTVEGAAGKYFQMWDDGRVGVRESTVVAHVKGPDNSIKDVEYF